MAHRPLRPAGRRSRTALLLALAIALGGGAAGLAYAQSAISLNSPVSFPVDI